MFRVSFVSADIGLKTKLDMFWYVSYNQQLKKIYMFYVKRNFRIRFVSVVKQAAELSEI